MTTGQSLSVEEDCVAFVVRLFCTVSKVKKKLSLSTLLHFESYLAAPLNPAGDEA